MIRFLIDENLASLYREQLLRLEPAPVVRAVGDPDAPPRGAPDEEILRWCEENDFLLVTDNRSTMPVHLANHLMEGHRVPGILTIRPRASIGKVLEALEAIAGAAFEGEYRDRIVFIPFL
jgi:hypothetical protein